MESQNPCDCLILYRHDGNRVFGLSVMRGEMRFRKPKLIKHYHKK
ncbi:MAG: hypothetical protein ABIP85_05255 [Chthoniobacteraceae bacterium]